LTGIAKSEFCFFKENMDMNKQLSRLLGLDQIFDLIEVPSDFIAAVKRHKIGRQRLSIDEIKAAYQRRALLLKKLGSEKRPKWDSLLAHISELNPAMYRNNKLSIHEIFELKSFVWHYQALRAYMIQQEVLSYEIPDLGDLFELLDPDGGKIPYFRLSTAYSTKLAELDGIRQTLSLKLKHQRHELLSEARELLNLPQLKEEFVLARQQQDLIGKIKSSGFFVLNRESVANLGFTLSDNMETNELKRQIAETNKALGLEEDRVLEQLSAQISEHHPALEQAVQTVKELGWDYALADFALRYDCCIPRLGEEIKLKQARNLPLQLSLEAGARPYQKLDLSFSAAANLITGPNMGGKTSILKCLAQCAYLLKYAIPLPAESATLPLYDFVYYNHATQTDNLSSFGAEVVDFTKALQQSGRGLFLLDEFAKGTNPREGEALATAVITYLVQSIHTTVAATHFSAPAQLKMVSQYQIKGIDSSFAQHLEDDLGSRLIALAKAMDYSLISLSANRTVPMNALKIARILGLPDEILKLIPPETKGGIN
jgi:DNA mismatch repair ATPase MutS